MTRKRFVKLAMSQGWDRNSACWLARFLVARRWTLSDIQDAARGGLIGCRE